MISLDNHEMNYKLKTSGGFDTMVSEAETLRLEDIEKIKFDLHEEKSNIRYQEDKLNMLIRKFKIQEDKIEEEKRFIQKRKDGIIFQIRITEEDRVSYPRAVSSRGKKAVWRISRKVQGGKEKL